jgi:hypothetical protein
MGTRNVTIVKLDGKVVIAKYCQWDGYINGQGLDLCNFIRNDLDLRKLKNNIRKCYTISDEKADEIFDDYLDQKTKLSVKDRLDYDKTKALQMKLVPTLTRDTGGGDILKAIQDQGGLPLSDNKGSLDYAKGTGEMSFGCEYCYEVDLDNKTVGIYDGHYKAKNLLKTYSFRSIKTVKSIEKTLENLENNINAIYELQA